jgi:hypothetical protein
MPREQINYPDRHKLVTDGTAANPEIPDRADEEPTLHVNWDNDHCLVQVSLNMTAERIKRWADQLDGSVSHSAFYTPALTRGDINRLIRVLRTARDKAYGRDE